jgi:amino acid permease
MVSSNLYLKAREMCPNKPESMYEQGFTLMGKSSIYLIAFLTFIQTFGLIIIFFQILGGTMAQFFTNIFWSDVLPEDKNFGMDKACWIIVMTILLLPTVLMKELAELKIVSISLFSSVLSFVIILTIQLISRGNELSNLDTERAYWKPNNQSNAEFIQAIVIIATAFNF